MWLGVCFPYYYNNFLVKFVMKHVLGIDINSPILYFIFWQHMKHKWKKKYIMMCVRTACELSINDIGSKENESYFMIIFDTYDWKLKVNQSHETNWFTEKIHNQSVLRIEITKSCQARPSQLNDFKEYSIIHSQKQSNHWSYIICPILLCK